MMSSGSWMSHLEAKMPNAKDAMGNGLPFWLPPLVIILACIVGYYSILSIGFLCDDFIFIYYFQNASLTDIGSGGVYFRPLVLLSLALDWHIFGEWATGFHLVNLALHIAASLGVVACTRLLLGRQTPALLAGLIFVLHPIHPEAVSWISGRFDLLCGALLVWSLYCHLRTYNPAVRATSVFRITSLVLFGLACLAKEAAFTFPLIIILYEFFPIGNTNSNQPQLLPKVIRILPYFLIAGIFFTLRLAIIGGVGGYMPEEPLSQSYGIFLYRIFIQPFYVLLLPINRAILNPAGTISTVIIYAILLLPILMLFVNRPWKVILFLLGAIILSVLPTFHMGVFEARLQSARYLYIASIFFSIFIAAILTGGTIKEKYKRIGNFLAVIYCATLLFGLQQNNYPWREAGRMVQQTTESTDELIDHYEGEWGVSKQKLIAFNVPTDFLGALTFKMGFPEMLHVRYEELENVEIEIIPAGVQTPENIEKISKGKQEDTVIWLFQSKTWAFVDYENTKPGDD